MTFKVDHRIEESCVLIGAWPLSTIYFKNDANFPWVILVPREKNIQEIYQLTEAQQARLIGEISRLSSIVMDYFKPDKLNVGALGNVVPQLHVHIVARFKGDKAWPHAVWQSGIEHNVYSADELDKHLDYLRMHTT